MKKFAVSFMSYDDNELTTLLIEAENWVKASEAHPGCCWKVEEAEHYTCKGLIAELRADREDYDVNFDDHSIDNKELIQRAKQCAFDRDHAFDVIEVG